VPQQYGALRAADSGAQFGERVPFRHACIAVDGYALVKEQRSRCMASVAASVATTESRSTTLQIEQDVMRAGGMPGSMRAAPWSTVDGAQGGVSSDAAVSLGPPGLPA